MKTFYAEVEKIKDELDKIYPIVDLQICFYPVKKILTIAIFLDNAEEDTLMYQQENYNLPTFEVLLFDLQVLLSEFVDK